MANNTRSKRILSVVALAMAMATNAVAARPVIYPTRDVTVTYARRDGKHVIVKMAKGGYPVRIEFPDQPDKDWHGQPDLGESYFVVLSPGAVAIPNEINSVSNFFYVWNKEREYKYSEHGWDDWPGKLRLSSTGRGDMIAGIMCDDWEIKGVAFTVHGKQIKRPDSVCLAEDGVMLRFLDSGEMFDPTYDGSHDTNYVGGKYPASMIAQSVSYDPLPADTFAIPKGYKRAHWPVPMSPPLPPPDPAR